MKISNNIPIIEHEDVINTFTKNLKKKRKEKGYTQRQLADILDVTLKTYRSWEKNTLPKTLELINLSINYLIVSISTIINNQNNCACKLQRYRNNVYNCNFFHSYFSSRFSFIISSIM